MSKKSKNAYTHVFEYIEKNIFELSNAASFTTDYELAMRTAIAECNPTARMYACHFHFAQACKRRASQIDGFVHLVRTNKDVECIYYRLMCLPLLPAQYIADAFNALKAEARVIKKRALKQFVSYYERQWIIKVNFFCLCLFSLFRLSTPSLSHSLSHTHPMLLYHSLFTGRSTQNKRKWCQNANHMFC